MTDIALCDFEPYLDMFAEEIMSGLRQDVKTLPCKYFYDERGSQLFDLICELPEYYPTRTEMGILRAHIGEMAALLGAGCRLVEYGSGRSLKTRILLDNAPDLASYVPIDISREHLYNSARALCKRYPDLEVLPVCADYTQDFSLPCGSRAITQSVVYFPGSTIGNFTPKQAIQFLRQIADLCGRGGGLLIGVDMKKAPQILELAYNDAQGVTAAFNLNLLARINRELDADFDLTKWEHFACYNPLQSRIEMHLVSLCDQQVSVGGARIEFAKDEMIHTESSYKYGLNEFEALARKAGWQVAQVWMDPERLFSVQYLTVARCNRGAI
ncbi:MAG: L-histidine N(alpha)-methyltransferase [Capsulimonas sp.]|uniref:L-histidine N(alpha)-methyltransferase n=1 Tax=Capsulimonas sp. TaxID=2494211 RepID=UPI00326741F8